MSSPCSWCALPQNWLTDWLHCVLQGLNSGLQLLQRAYAADASHAGVLCALSHFSLLKGEAEQVGIGRVGLGPHLVCMYGLHNHSFGFNCIAYRMASCPASLLTARLPSLQI